uniref:Putative DNA mismatch repair protein MLH3 isoform X1 n=2 Tax=Davidia involucrata TaxID=16924 RepID=A0A5B7BWE8_DAVIN
MGNIKHLPEAVHSSVRSGIILFDLTRVVEELIFNSLDAGALKVCVAIGVGTCYVKVVDNGSGITRDGLVLLGERYATSKLDQLADMDDATGSFGFRGETLGSISDVSLLEIVTKAHGRPNGYRKVMKGCKCLYLGIDDDRQDVGTTVIVRDLFYNQPVRRKHMQSSPKKVLHSVKKCVLRIAFVHPKVSFKFVDIESEDELLCTYPSLSPLSLLTSSFGIEVSSSLRELDVSDGVLKLSGYMTGPCDTSSVKAFQYVYINSRYICKGPIHKLLNQLATRFNCSDQWKANIRSQNGKRSRSQTYATYILNLSCPRSCYDLTFEPSKTSVEFKDWVSISNFIEKAITNFWSEYVSYGDSLSHGTDISRKDDMWKEGDNLVSVEEDFPAKFETAKKRCRIQNHQASFGLPSHQLKMLTEESDHMSHWKDSKSCCRKSCRNASEFREHQTGIGFDCQTDYSFQSCDGSFAQCRVTENEEGSSHMWAHDNNIFCAEDHFFGNKLFPIERSNEYTNNVLGSRWEDTRLKVGANMSNGLTECALSCDCFEFGDDMDKVSKNLKKPFLQSCSSRSSLPPDEVSFASDEGFQFQIGGFRTKWKRLDSGDRVDLGELDDSNQRSDFLPRTLWQNEEESSWSSPRLVTKCDMHTGLEFLSRDSIKSLPVAGECFAEENDLLPDSATQIGKFGSSHWSFYSKWSSVTSDPLLGTKPLDVECFIEEDALERHIKYDNSARHDYWADRGGRDNVLSSNTMQNNFICENRSSLSCTNISTDFKGYTGSKEDICEFLQGYNQDDVFFPSGSDAFTDETEWLCLDSRGKDRTKNCAVPSHHSPSSIYIDKDENQRNQLIYQEEKYICKRRPRRSHSAPPFYKGKKTFFALNNQITMEAGKPNAQSIHDAPTLREASGLKHPQLSSGACQIHSKPGFVEDSLIHTRPDLKRTLDMNEIQKCEMQKKSQGLRAYNMDSVEDIMSKEIQDSLDSGLKWRKSCPQPTNRDRSHDHHNQDSILDISSGLLHLAGDSLVPESISKNCLEDAKVLQQVDKKFIPVVAGEVLALIDQHAADERIRLEELRQKVLSGEMKTITHLDAEQELVLPEIGYQLLHNYAEQIQNWGWICNIHAQGLRSFKKNLNLLHRRPSTVTLLAVPCILGVNLTDIDLLEFLQQLADTDGSSTIPPSVLRVLNFKACRGAIMFGDPLLPSECSLIVEELKHTSLCFQCAHGRPTTAPLVNLGALHKQIAKLGSWNGGSNKLWWHGLRRHELSLERSKQRLSSARGLC